MFFRFDKDGKAAGTGQVKIILYILQINGGGLINQEWFDDTQGIIEDRPYLDEDRVLRQRQRVLISWLVKTPKCTKTCKFEYKLLLWDESTLGP